MKCSSAKVKMRLLNYFELGCEGSIVHVPRDVALLVTELRGAGVIQGKNFKDDELSRVKTKSLWFDLEPRIPCTR